MLILTTSERLKILFSIFQIFCKEQSLVELGKKLKILIHSKQEHFARRCEHMKKSKRSNFQILHRPCLGRLCPVPVLPPPPPQPGPGVPGREPSEVLGSVDQTGNPRVWKGQGAEASPGEERSSQHLQEGPSRRRNSRGGASKLQELGREASLAEAHQRRGPSSRGVNSSVYKQSLILNRLSKHHRSSGKNNTLNTSKSMGKIPNIKKRGLVSILLK